MMVGQDKGAGQTYCCEGETLYVRGMMNHGWLTSDAQELEARRLRAKAEAMSLRNLMPGHGIFADFSVRRDDQEAARTYIVEIRSLRDRVNYCTCPDFAKNSLGSCKHIEKVVMQLEEQLGAKVRPERSPFVEVFMGRTADYKPQMVLPAEMDGELQGFVHRYLNALGELKGPWQSTLQLLLADLREVSHTITNKIRVSREVYELADELQRRQELASARSRFEQEVLDGERPLQFLRRRLYDYQIKGMMHLGFTGRAMLCDEMGLGKSVQAIAAAHILRELWGVRQVLVVCPGSLKAEWEEQIRKFSDLPVALASEDRESRLALYRAPEAFFVVVNYEQVLHDEQEINGVLRPGLIILDEAQRIKNWQTQTARSIKQLRSEFAFVLTGTPLEGRIDEIYSIVEFINPRIFGSLFRFNRDFYELDEKGRVVGYKNLGELHERLRPILLRRQKQEILSELPPRLDNTYFVKLTATQRKLYAECEGEAAKLINQARQGALTAADYQQLQLRLTEMRMACDSPVLLGQEPREAPKVDELFNILDDIWDSRATRKVLVFSEWEEMLKLVRQRLEKAGIGFAWQPDGEATEAVERFSREEGCRVFLTTDSGASRFDLQAASVVVNLDLPWNPARLEQRIWRAWRHGRKRPISVITMIAEETLEHRLLATLHGDEAAASDLLDAESAMEDLALPSGRAAFLRRLEQVVDMRLAPTVPVVAEAAEAAVSEPAARRLSPAARLTQELGICLGPRLLLFRGRIGGGELLERGFVVVTEDSAALRQKLEEVIAKTHGEEWRPELQVLTREEYALLQRLAQAGLIGINDRDLQEFYRAGTFGQFTGDEAGKRRRMAEPLLIWAERQSRMASCLAQGEFLLEGVEPMREAVDHAARALAVLCVTDPLTRAPEQFSRTWLAAIREQPEIDGELLRFLGTFGSFQPEDEEEAREFLETGRRLIDNARERLVRLSL